MEKKDPWFDSLYIKYAPVLFKTAVILLNNPSIAEEIVQDVFLILLFRRSKVEHYENICAWLFKVLHNRIQNEIHRAYRTKELPFLPEYEEIIGCDGQFDQLEDLLPAGLSEADKQILLWYYEDGLTCAEIGKRLHRTEQACCTRLYRARERCRKLLLEK